MPVAIEWAIFILGCAFIVVSVLQRRAIKRKDRERTEALGAVMFLLAYLEAQARAAKDRPGNHTP